MARRKRIYLIVCSILFCAGGLPALQNDGHHVPPSERNTSQSHATRLREQYVQFQKNRPNNDKDPIIDPEYETLLDSLGYYDELASNIEKRIHANIENCAQDPTTWRALGHAWMRIGPAGREKAHTALREALRLNEADAESWTLLGHLLHREQLYSQAQNAYEKALSLDTNQVLAEIGLVILSVRQGAIVEASEKLDRLGTTAQPFDVTLRLMIRQALRDFEYRGGYFDDTAAHHAAYARLLYRAGRIADALVALRRTIELEPTDYKAWNLIGAMCLQLGDREQGRNAYQKSLEINPDQPHIRSALQTMDSSRPPSP